MFLIVASFKELSSRRDIRMKLSLGPFEGYEQAKDIVSRLNETDIKGKGIMGKVTFSVMRLQAVSTVEEAVAKIEEVFATPFPG